MKKFIGLIVMGLILTQVGFCNYTGQLGQYQTSNDIAIKNVTCTAANTTYPVTFDAGTVNSFTLLANGGAINVALTPSLTASKITIPSGASLWDHLPIPMPLNKTLYIWSATAGSTLEAFYTYY